MPIVTSTRRSKLPAGSTLLEGVLAIGVIMVGVVGSLVLVLTTINLGRTNQDRIVAQNLAREGMELAYAHRNAGSLSTVELPDAAWDMYLQTAIRRSTTAGGESYDDKYNLGDIDNGVCKYYRKNGCAGGETGCTSQNDDNYSTTPAALMCDIQPLIDYMFLGGTAFPPPGCDETSPDHLTYWDGSDNTRKQCNFNKGPSDVHPDISDLVTMIYELLQASFQYQAGYPTIALKPSGSVTTPSSTLKFYIPNNGTDFTTGKYSLAGAWTNTTQSQVYEVDGTFTQNVSGLTGATPSKFYRVVTFQPICRARLTSPLGPYSTWVLDQDVALNCFDAANNLLGGGNKEVAKIGVLVTSEVRWPTPTSRTRVNYQEYLYDWIDL